MHGWQPEELSGNTPSQVSFPAHYRFNDLSMKICLDRGVKPLYLGLLELLIYSSQVADKQRHKQ